MAIQGRDVLDDPQQVDGFRALCGLGRAKPFECVGEVGESRAALAALAANPLWSRHRVVRVLAPELSVVEVPAVAELLRPASGHCIPAEIAALLGEGFQQ